MLILGCLFTLLQLRMLLEFFRYEQKRRERNKLTGQFERRGVTRRMEVDIGFLKEDLINFKLVEGALESAPQSLILMDSH